MSGAVRLNGLLGGYRVLDLAQGGCMLCGKVLADLGADVIKIEKPGGDPSRNLGPFHKDQADPEKSLYWLAYSNNKRSITLNIETKDGQELFKKLAANADFVIESFAPDYLNRLRLGYPDLSRINSRIILTSITPYGQDGPKAHYKSCELADWASGGQLATMGDPDRPPTWISFPQASLNAAAQAAAGTMVAHCHREKTGEGQQVDVSIQQSVAWTIMGTTQMWEFNQFEFVRAGAVSVNPKTGVQEKWVFPCKDGYVTAYIHGGGAAFAAASARSLVEWINEDGMAPKWLLKFDWVSDYDSSKLTQELVDRVGDAISRFLMTKTKQEIWQEAFKRSILLVPVATAEDIYRDEQLRSRDFWVRMRHEELGE